MVSDGLPVRVAIGLGASLGPRRLTLERTVMALHATPGLRVLAVSRWYRSPPMAGGTAVGRFLNGVVLLHSTLDPWQVLARCRELELASGRRRARFWGDRTLDLDVLAVEGWTSDDPDLRVPHPGLCSRPFVYVPLAEVWPEALPRGVPPAPVGLWAVGALAWPRGPA